VNPQLSRRRFIKGVIASSVAAASSAGIHSASAQDGSRGAVERLISLNVNGQTRRVDVAPQETLAYTLRYKLGLTGTKLGCNRGECGACTVIIEGITNYSCSVRFLHTGADHVGGCIARGKPAAVTRRGPPGDGRQPLPLRCL
jgi:hypothetical protein